MANNRGIVLVLVSLILSLLMLVALLLIRNSSAICNIQRGQVETTRANLTPSDGGEPEGRLDMP